MKLFCNVILYCLLITSFYAQAQQDSIRVSKNGKQFMYQGKFLKPKKLLLITKPYPEAYAQMKTARTNYVFESLFTAAGGFCIGYSIGAALGRAKLNGGLIAAGLVSAGISIPFSVAYRRHAREAVRIYNNKIRISSYNRIDFKLQLCDTGLKLKAKF